MALFSKSSHHKFFWCLLSLETMFKKTFWLKMKFRSNPPPNTIFGPRGAGNTEKPQLLDFSSVKKLSMKQNKRVIVLKTKGLLYEEQRLQKLVNWSQIFQFFCPSGPCHCVDVASHCVNIALTFWMGKVARRSGFF